MGKSKGFSRKKWGENGLFSQKAGRQAYLPACFQRRVSRAASAHARNTARFTATTVAPTGVPAR